jgi:hypothetical protein
MEKGLKLKAEQLGQKFLQRKKKAQIMLDRDLRIGYNPSR